MKAPGKMMGAGAGLGGLSAAIALRRAGFEVTVFELAAELGVAPDRRRLPGVLRRDMRR